MKKIFFVLSMFLWLTTTATTYYVAPPGNGGSNTNSGSILSPWATWEYGFNQLVAGDFLLIRGGTYTSPRGGSAASASQHTLFQNRSGTSSVNRINVWNYPGEFPVLDLTAVGVPTYSDPTGFIITGCNYVYIKGLRLTGLQQNHGGSGISRGFHIESSANCLFEFIEVDHIGGYGFYLRNGANDNYFLNCDAHHMDDRWSSPGAWGGSNGFDCTGGVNATRNTFDGCRAWWCSDDGFDFYATLGIQTLKNCWSFWNGYEPGTFTGRADGDGFKMSSTGTNSGSNLRTVINCLAFGNRKHGFNTNGGGVAMTFYNNTAYANGVVDHDPTESPAGFMSAYGATPTLIVKNNASLGNFSATYSGSTFAGTGGTNTWNGGVTLTTADFISVSSVGVDGPRNSDGTLPVLNFLKLTSGSDLIDAGTDVGLPFNGAAPDRGAYEFGAVVNIAPSANAGPDQTITNSIVSLSGSGSDPDGTVSSYLWTKIAGSGGVIESSSSASTRVTGLSAGQVYDFQLRVTDNSGASTIDVVRIIVSAVAPGPGGTDTVVTLIKNIDVTLRRTWFSNYADVSWSGVFKNCKTMSVERRLNGGAFSSVKTITVSNPATTNYKHSDTRPPSGLLGYRIKAVNSNGSFVYSAIKEVKKN